MSTANDTHARYLCVNLHCSYSKGKLLSMHIFILTVSFHRSGSVVGVMCWTISWPLPITSWRLCWLPDNCTKPRNSLAHETNETIYDMLISEL